VISNFCERIFENTRVLHDIPKAEFFKNLPSTDPIFRDIGRNDPCPCGSGKKFKKCHGR
jgi:uncharacterized protein YecA (UPF0149 family)